jgi:hypothetical protein
LRESGFIEGKNIIIERRFAEGRADRYAELVAELVRLNMDLIVTSGDTATLAAKRATTKIRPYAPGPYESRFQASRQAVRKNPPEAAL